jgi:hypothetical protein
MEAKQRTSFMVTGWLFGSLTDEEEDKVLLFMSEQLNCDESDIGETEVFRSFSYREL